MIHLVIGSFLCVLLLFALSLILDNILITIRQLDEIKRRRRKRKDDLYENNH